MSSSSNSRTGERRARGTVTPAGMRARRFTIQALLVIALASIAGGPARAGAGPDLLAGLRRWGSGQYRRFGFLIYEATLWAGSDPLQPPMALRLDYRRSIAGADIAEASAAEMRRLGVDTASLARWRPLMENLFPDVKPGDHILGLHGPAGASFVYNGRALGAIEEADFARSFFAIWLDPRSSAPQLRAALLGLPVD